ncbi:hypothetical protein MRB53_006686 [Persea americana]|uniref:Uncharacterized protein n=1 Tax=Persea americana TaxID=3435 RepID=A0ACC2MHS3_PERAE|nr:hypothetical protein MRB53_006686 [Persea americana]
MVRISCSIGIYFFLLLGGVNREENSFRLILIFHHLVLYEWAYVKNPKFHQGQVESEIKNECFVQEGFKGKCYLISTDSK